MKKLFVFVFLFLMTGVAYCDNLAKNFVFPIFNYKENDGCLNWGGYNGNFPGKKHVADDFCCSIGTKVLAPANGVVKFVYYDSNNLTFPHDWYGLLVIEHNLGNRKVCSILGHCKVVNSIKVGTEVKVGQYVADIIEYPPGADHLHFGVYDGAFVTEPGDGISISTWCVGYLPEGNWPGNYLSPVQFIKDHNSVGYYSDGFHADGTSQPFIDSFTRLSPTIGWPSDNGGGVFVHQWVSTYDSSYKVFAQDYQGDNQSMLILDVLNSPHKANWVKGGFCYLYRTSDGPRAYGIAYTEEITHSYANSPDSQVGDIIQPGNRITAQKYQQVYYYNNSPNAGQRKTMVWKEGIEAQHFPVGEYAIYAESCSGVCPKEGDQVYVIDNDHPGVNEYSYDKPWPLAGKKITNGTTGIWFTKPVTPKAYNFTLHNANGTRKMGWGLTVQITEGNHQFSGNDNSIDTTVTVATPQNVSATAVSETEIDLSWNGNNGSNPVVYRIYRKVQSNSGEPIYIGSTSSTSFSDSFLNPGATYYYQVSASYGGLESSNSQEVSATTPTLPNLNLPTADFSLDRTVVNPGSLIFFIDHSSGTQISSWYWEFGDGGTSTLQNPSHRFNYAGHYDVSLTVINMYGSRTTVKRSCLYVLAGILGAEWGSTNIGNAPVNGYASYDSTSGRYIIDGTGLGVDESHSQFTYMYKPHTGCANFSTRILSQTLSGSKAMSGIMFMETASSSSSYVMIAVTQGQGVIFQYKQNGVVTKAGGDYYDFPIYLKLVRNVNTFKAYYSFTNNSDEWNLIGSADMNFATDYQTGIFATPANSSGVSTAVFDSLNVSNKPEKVKNLKVIQ